MKITKQFVQELSSFSKNNWWVYIVYLLLVGLILNTQGDNLLPVILTSSCHFVADIFIMMMISAYGSKDYKNGTIFQIASMLIFFMIKLVTGYRTGEWHYLTADLIYALAAYKNYLNDIRHKSFKILETKYLLILSVFIFIVISNLKYWGFQTTVFSNSIQIFQTIGIFSFGIALSIINNEKRRYFASVLSLSLMVISSIIETTNSFLIDKYLTGLEISYSLLPLTVLVYYLKNINQYFIIKRK